MTKKETLFLRWLETQNIEGILFDLDDTLIKTNEVFSDAVESVVKLYVQAMPNIPKEQVAQIFYDTNIEKHQLHAVNPNRWEHVIPAFEEKIQIPNTIRESALQILAEIYTKKVEFEAGAEALLQKLQSWGLMLGLVTHANVEWTLFKLESLGLSTFFDWVEIVDEDRLHKNSADWQTAAQQINLSAHQVLGAGDNVKGDVQAAVEAGFGQVAWIDKKNGWQHYKEGQLPSGVHVIKRVSDLPTIAQPTNLQQKKKQL